MVACGRVSTTTASSFEESGLLECRVYIRVQRYPGVKKLPFTLFVSFNPTRGCDPRRVSQRSSYPRYLVGGQRAGLGCSSGYFCAWIAIVSFR